MMGRSADADLLSGINAIVHLGVVANLSDAQLLDGFLTRTGEAAEAAFEALVARHGRMVLDVCWNVLRDPHDAQDAFQATFLILAAKAASIRQRDTVAGWLLGVARRVAVRSRVNLVRKRQHEERAAEMRADRPGDEPKSWEELHEEIGRLPGRYREPLVLCYLEGLSTDAAASRLGCPKGTVLSRLSRARERLRDRLTRRGLAPGAGVLTAGVSPAAAPVALSQGLLTSTTRASLTFAAQPAIAASHATTTAVALARGVLHAMTISKLKLLVGAMLIGVLIPSGLWTFRALAQGSPEVKVDPEAAARGPGQEEGDRPGVGHVDRINFDQLYVGAIAEARPAFIFAGVRDPGLSLKIDVPRFATVKGVGCFRMNEINGGGVRCVVTVALDTRSAGKLAGDLKVRLGGQEASVPVAASVKPPEAGRPKVLLISHEFAAISDRADYYQPWFDLVQDAGLDVSYMDSDSVPVQLRPGELREELTRYDVILLADGGVAGLGANPSHMLGQLAQSGKRVIVTASPSWEASVPHANRILEPAGMQMLDEDIDVPDVSGSGLPIIEAARLRDDALLEGIRKLSTIRPAPIRIQDSEKAKMLAYFAGSQQGFAAVARHGKGEIVAIGITFLADWIGEHGRGTDNARFLKNLLTTKVGR
jgi:RNA polymerase sigma factor (sigma-70 family)